MSKLTHLFHKENIAVRESYFKECICFNQIFETSPYVVHD